MAELRRLLVEPARLKKELGPERLLTLKSNESHYLFRVLRLRCGESIEIVDGVGNLWKADLNSRDSIRLQSSLHFPIAKQPRCRPLLGLAVVVPKKGFDELLRMSCEIGIDFVQPLRSERSVVLTGGEHRNLRWEGVLRESVEQSERLWAPDCRRIIDVKDWLKNRPVNSALAFASPRMLPLNRFHLWTNSFRKQVDELWIAIGPEGGWTEQEKSFAKEVGCSEVFFGDSILRTSTAAVVATQLMVSWRQNSSMIVE